MPAQKSETALHSRNVSAQPTTQPHLRKAPALSHLERLQLLLALLERVQVQVVALELAAIACERGSHVVEPKPLLLQFRLQAAIRGGLALVVVARL